MAKSLDDVVEKVKKLSKDRQRYATEVLEQIAEAGDDTYILSSEERRLLREELDELNRGEVASEDEVRATFDKYRT